MRPRRIKQVVLILALGFALALIALLIFISNDRPPKILGSLYPADLDAVRSFHRTNCPLALSKTLPVWIPASLRHYISGRLNPIETIAVPSSEHVVIVYRGYEKIYYDKRGKHRFGHATYDLYKGPNGWYVPNLGLTAPSAPTTPSGVLPPGSFSRRPPQIITITNGSPAGMRTQTVMTANGPVEVYVPASIAPIPTNFLSAPYRWGINPTLPTR